MSKKTQLTLPAKKDSKAPVDLNVMAEIIGTEDPEIVHPILKSFMESLEADFEPMLAAIDAKEGAKLKSLAHANKGSANSCGALPLGEVLRALEQVGLHEDWETAEAHKDALKEQFSNIKEFITAEAIA